MTKRLCRICNEPLGRFFGHPKCESIAHVRLLDAHGDISDQRAAYLAQAGWVPAKAPTMRTINGIGTKLYWRRDVDEGTGSATQTLYFVFLFLPVLPLDTYRVVESSNGYFMFLARRSVSAGDWMPATIVWWLALIWISFSLDIAWAGWALLAIGLIAGVDLVVWRRKKLRGPHPGSRQRPT